MGRLRRGEGQITKHLAAPDQQSGSRSRAPRPNQRGPEPRYGNKRERESDSDDDEPSSRQPKPSGISHKERRKRWAEAQAARRDPALLRYIKSAPKMKAWQEQMQDWRLEHLQKRLIDVEEDVKFRHMCCAEAKTIGCLVDVPPKRKQYRDLGLIGFISVRQFKCETCAAVISVEPEDVGCFPLSPSQQNIWLDQMMLENAQYLALRGGLSAGTFCALDAHLSTFHNPKGATLLNDQGNGFTPSLRSPQLTDAYLEYGQMVSRAMDPWGGVPPTDPFRDCLVCASTSRSELTDHTPLPDTYHLCVSTDAMVKACRYANSGSGQAGIMPATSTYLGGVNDDVATDYAEGRLKSVAQQRKREEAKAAAESGRLLPPCTSNLSCSRETSNARGEVDMAGLVGCTCHHGIAGYGLFVALLTPENHQYYEYVLEWLLRWRPDLHTVFLDVACRFKNRWDALRHRMVEQGVATERIQEVLLLLPWMHACDHDLECQLKFSGLYKGHGRRHGEVLEQFWSLLKPLTKLARYMSAAHWQDAYNLAIASITRTKQRGFAELLVSRINANKRKIEACRKDLKDVKEEAAKFGVTDLEAALAAVEELDSTPVEMTLSLRAKYVQALVLLRAHSSLADNKAGLALLLPGTMGLKVHAKGADEDYKTKLATRVEDLAQQLKVGLGETWKKGDVDYDEGLRETRTALSRHYQYLIELQVFKYKMVHLKKQDESGKSATKLGTRLRTIRNDIKQLLDVRRTWLAFGQETVVPAESLDDVCAGNFPWRGAAPSRPGAQGEEGPSEAVIHHFGRRYRTATAQLKRSEEEDNLLQDEILRSYNWVEERLIEVGDRIDRELAQSLTAENAGDRIALEEHLGRGSLCRREEARLLVIQEEAKAKLEKYRKQRPPPVGAEGGDQVPG